MQTDLGTLFYSAVADVIKNVEEDRQKASELLEDVRQHLRDVGTYNAAGSIAGKYLEAMQRSNEQLIKIASLVQKVTVLAVDEEEVDYDSIMEEVERSREEGASKDA